MTALWVYRVQKGYAGIEVEGTSAGEKANQKHANDSGGCKLQLVKESAWADATCWFSSP